MREVFSTRRIKPDEWQIFSDLRLRSLKECAASLGVNHEQECGLTREQWQAWLVNENKPAFGLFADDKLIGITGLFLDSESNIGYLGGSYIIPDYRGCGLSALLNRTRIEWAADFLPCQRLRVAHRVGNVTAVAATRKAGLSYELTDSRKWPDGTEGNQDWYHLNLEGIRRERKPSR